MNTQEKNDEAGLSYLWLQREQEGGQARDAKPTGMKTSGMPNLELIRSSRETEGVAVAQETQRSSKRTPSFAHMHR